MILAKTVKGWTLGPGVEARNITHQAKKLNEAELQDLPRPARAADPGRAAQGSAVLPPGPRLRGGPVPPRAAPGARRPAARSASSAPQPLPAPAPAVDAEFAAGSTTPVSTTMVFARILRNLIRDKELGPRIVPIIPDEARTFGMDPLFKEVGIYSALGQRYEPVDSDLVLSYREATDGQVLEEGITEAGSMASFQAAGTSYATHGLPMIPFYIFYSMFGFQRTGDQIWAFGDARGRGFLMGATAGRTTLTGEGLQHDDGHTQILRLDRPERARLRPGLRLRAGRDRPRRHRADVRPEARGRLLLRHALQRELRPAGPARGRDRRGDPARHLPLRGGARPRAATRTRPGSSARARSSSRSSRRATSWPRSSASPPRSTARRRSRCCAATRSRPSAGTGSIPTPRRRASRTSATILPHDGGPIVAATDWMKALPDMVSRWLPPHYVALGTDGFGRSDTREALRALFEIDPPHIAAATLVALARCGALPAAQGGQGDPRARHRPGQDGPAGPLTLRRAVRPPPRRHASDTSTPVRCGTAVVPRSVRLRPSTSFDVAGPAHAPASQ